MIYSRFDSDAFLLSLETQTSADDVKGEPTQEQKTTEAFEKEELEEEDYEMEGEIGNGKPEERNENEDPSWTPEEADAAYKKKTMMTARKRTDLGE